MDDDHYPPDFDEVPDSDPELKAKLAEHLDGPEELLRYLVLAVNQVISSMVFEEDWRGPEIKRVRDLARQLDDAIGRLPGYTDGGLEHIFHLESRRLFPEGVEQCFPDNEHAPYFWRFREQLRFLSSPALETRRSRGRPQEKDRDQLAAEAAKLFVTYGVTPTKYGDGVFAEVLKDMFRAAGFAPPDDMYRVVARAIDGLDKKRQGEQ